MIWLEGRPGAAGELKAEYWVEEGVLKSMAWVGLYNRRGFKRGFMGDGWFL